MRNVWTIAVKELRSYFVSPIGYVTLAFWLFGVGLSFALGVLQSQQATMQDWFSTVEVLLLFIGPALTMRLLVESVPLADGVIGAGTEITWPKPMRPGMALQVFSEITDIRPSRSKPGMAIVTLRSETRDQLGETVLIFTARMPVFKRGQDWTP